MQVYLIGSLRNKAIPELGNRLRKETSWKVFDDWFAAGPEADDHWRDYERAKGNNLQLALKGAAAQHVFNFDRTHLDSSDAAVLLWPAGKSGHLELGYMAGRGKLTYIVTDGEPERFDVMLNFADKVFTNYEDLIAELNGFSRPISVVSEAPVSAKTKRPGSWYRGRGLTPPSE